MGWNHRFLAICFCTLLVTADTLAQAPFQIEETTISRLQSAIKARTLKCHDLVQLYLDRIDAYDKRGPAINALITINLRALSAPTNWIASLPFAVSLVRFTAFRLL